MRIILGYPPLTDPRGYIQVGQNRQSKIFSVGEEAAIFPCVMAWAATMLKREGYDVRWLDGQTMGWTWERYLLSLKLWKPDLVCWEVKTPSALRTYEAVKQLKASCPETIVVLVGDHVGALPQEALSSCPVDVILVSGDYHFGLLNIVKHLKERTIAQQPEWEPYNGPAQGL